MNKRRGISKSISLGQIMFFSMLALSAAPARSEPASKQISEDYFCLHVHSHKNYEEAFSRVPFGILRTWDSSIGWPQIEPENDKWNWELLDNYARLAREKNIRLIMTLGMTPKWAAKNPDAPSPYGGEWSSSPPRNLADWEDFIRELARRNEREYGGAIRFWEIWNEPDNFQKGYEFYTGTPEDLAAMARAASRIIKEINPDNLILSPGITQVGQSWLERFLKSGGGDYVDIITYHFYWNWFTPSLSDFEAGIASLKKVMDRNGCGDKPIWVTETGFDVTYFKTADKRNMALAQMIIAPGYYGADVLCAYSWNGGVFTNMYDSSGQKPTQTAAAYVELHSWLNGAAIVDLSAKKANTSVCTLERNGAMARVVWHYGPGKVKYLIDDSWGGRMCTLDGTNSPVPENRTIELGNNPIIIGNEIYFSP